MFSFFVLMDFGKTFIPSILLPNSINICQIQLLICADVSYNYPYQPVKYFFLFSLVNVVLLQFSISSPKMTGHRKLRKIKVWYRFYVERYLENPLQFSHLQFSLCLTFYSKFPSKLVLKILQTLSFCCLLLQSC